MNTIEKQTKTVSNILFGAMVFFILLSQTGCGTGPQGAMGPPGVNTTVPVPSNNSVTSIVSDYNAWRVDNGQEPITQGLDCTLYTVPQTTTGITAMANGGVAPVLTNEGAFTYQGAFNQANASVSSGLNILPNGLQAVYQTWFIVKCTGYLVVTSDDYHEFDVNSDDGSNLYVDGTLVVSNDGSHGAKDVSGTKHLQDTVHTFEIDFFQANGSEELVVNMDNNLLPAENLYH